MNYTLSNSLEVVLETCITCGCQFCMPSQLHSKVKENHTSFYCPNGHSMAYTGPTQAQKLQKQVDQLTYEKNQLQNKIIELERFPIKKRKPYTKRK
jgi:hypothetical protein